MDPAASLSQKDISRAIAKYQLESMFERCPHNTEMICMY